jgi:outer membrane protein assembly factor BamB
MTDHQAATRRTVLRGLGAAVGVGAVGSLGPTGRSTAATDAQTETAWSQFQVDAANRGITGASGPTSGEVAWTFTTGADIDETDSERTTTATSTDGTPTPTDAAGTPTDAAGTPTDGEPERIAAVDSSPAVVDGTAYVGSLDHYVYAVDVASGEQVWEYETGHQVLGSPTVVDGTVYVGSHDGHLHAIDAASGDRQWRFETDGTVFSSPKHVAGAGASEAADATLYFGSQAGTFYAVGTDGREAWSTSLGQRVVSTPAVVDGTVYVGAWTGDRTGEVRALDAASGDDVWTFPAQAPVSCSPTVVGASAGGGGSSDSSDGGTMYVGDYANVLYAVDVGSGDLTWGRELADVVFASPVVVDETIYTADTSGRLWALDVTNEGSLEWVFPTEGVFFSSPALADGVLYIGNLNSNVYAVDADDGEEVFAVETGDRVFSSPAVVDGRAYVGSSDGNLYAIEGSGGSQSTPTPSPTPSPTATPTETPGGTTDPGGNGTGTTTDTSSGSGPGFGVLAGLAGLGAGAGAWHRLRRDDES